ncbi:transposase, partial [Betaproteobacteria bacterium PRO5]|nr:transposase [Betaproteobacteria bacterium PRO5]
DEVLDAYLFDNIRQVQEITEQWLYEYNENRPHEALGNILPTQFMSRLTIAPILYNELST